MQQICCIFVAYLLHMKRNTLKTKPFSTKKSIARAAETKRDSSMWVIKDGEGKEYNWANTMERVTVIRQGIPYGYIEMISERLNRPVKRF